MLGIFPPRERKYESWADGDVSFTKLKQSIVMLETYVAEFFKELYTRYKNLSEEINK